MLEPRIVDPLSLPLISISAESAQWLVDSKAVAPAAGGLFYDLKPGKAAPKTPTELQRLGLVAPTTTTANIERTHAPYADALAVLGAPGRRVNLSWREVDTGGEMPFFLKGRFAASGFVTKGERHLSPAFSTQVLSSTLVRKITGPDTWEAALVPKAFALLGKLFVRDRKVTSRTEAELKAELNDADASFAALVSAKVMIKDGARYTPAPDYARALALTWSGHHLVIQTEPFDESGAKESFAFVGPPGERVWAYDQDVNGVEVSIFRSLDPAAAAELTATVLGS